MKVFKFQNQDREKTGEKTEITDEHEACGFGYQVVQYNGESNEPVIYRGEDTVEVFFNHLNCEVSNIHNKFSTPKPIIMTEEDEKNYNNNYICWIYENEII